MKTCPFCHQEIDEFETICPHCGMSLTEEEITDHAAYQPSLFEATTAELDNEPSTDEINESSTPVNAAETEKKVEKEENRKDKEFRMKNNPAPYFSLLGKITKFFTYFFEKLISPSDQFKRRRSNNGSYGYISFVIASFLSSFIVTRLVETAFSRYTLLSQISILPSLVNGPNYILLFIKLLVFFIIVYLAFPTIAFFIKRVLLKRHHIFHYWVTQYAGLNASGFIILLVAFLFSVVAPFSLAMVIIFLFTLHILSLIISFVASFYRTINDSKIDTIYLCLLGLSIEFFIIFSLSALFF